MPHTARNNNTSIGVAITGMGIISAIGNNVQENLDALMASEHGISKISHITTRHKAEIKVGEIALSNVQLSEKLQLPKDHAYSRTAMLGCLAAKEAVENAGIVDIENGNTGLISATSVGGMDLTEAFIKEYAIHPETQKYIKSHQAADSTERIADMLGINGFVTTISTACSSGANAIMMGARMIKAGKLDRVIVGGTDSLSKFTINGFKTLLILSDTNCTPFDANRKGLNLGEAAAYLVLESDAVVQRTNKKVLAYVSGYGNANDAFHQTASSENGDGAYLAMIKALQIAKLQTPQIDYINAHGTATPNNDLAESIAIKRVFTQNVPKFSSTKAFTGHTLAAAGAIEAVYSILALQENMIFPNLNFSNAIPETLLEPQGTILKKEINHVLSNSFGFGGNCTTLVFSKK